MTAAITLPNGAPIPVHRLGTTDEHQQYVSYADIIARTHRQPGQLWERAAEQEPAATGRIAVIAWRLSVRAVRLDGPGPRAATLPALRSGVIRPMEEAA